MGDDTIIIIQLILKPLWKNINPLFLYDNSSFIKYKNPPNIMLVKYKYTKLLKKYLKFLNPNDTNTINIEISILIMNKLKELRFINNDNILIPPTTAPSSILNNLAFLFNINDVDKSNKKSKKKLSKIIKSTYIFMLSP